MKCHKLKIKGERDIVFNDNVLWEGVCPPFSDVINVN